LSKLSAAGIICEEQFKLIKEYPAVIRVYENVAGDGLYEVVEKSTGEVMAQGTNGVTLPTLPRNRNKIASKIAYLDFIESCGPDVVRSYLKNRKYRKTAKVAASGVKA
jgi:hypothetical protein